MVTRAFAVEDGNLQRRSLVTSRTQLYKDIDLNFTAKTSGDVYKSTDAAAVKQAVKNLLLTNFGEKPFLPIFGGNLSALLFDLSDPELATSLDRTIKEAIKIHEPRAKHMKNIINVDPDRNYVEVTIEFQIISTSEIVTFTTQLTRLR